MDSAGLILILMFIAGSLATLVWTSAYIYYGRLWFRARVKECPVPVGQMMKMTLGGVSAFEVVTAHINAHLAGLGLTVDELEGHARDKGRVREVVRAMIKAQEAGTPISFAAARTLDLQGKAILEEVNSPA